MVFSQGERGKKENLLTFESEALSGQNVCTQERFLKEQIRNMHGG